ncbi:glycosyltransferase family 2 protein [Geobacter argillaceus]|uniref:Glycosyl transferase family 2 n=1 Tax=Geobacter argillaceus TaxID=345631 RepID=A0A562WRY1_9BACT|nr:glycosyltransferase family 2 protein [Geobacter argillaceus]TWJ33021.1 glycosyl transferase family 2 [Geobacter argillaceus]
MKPTIDILLATYNGSDYLIEQLDSIIGQTFADWRLLARDDGSTDTTPEILRAYQAQLPDRITIVPGEGRSLGARGNFAALMARADGDYLMFCDQDDVWLPDKIEQTLAEMRRLEKSHGETTPLMVHTDLAVVDEALRGVADSLWRFQHSDPVGGKALNRLLVQNTVTGCTVMINRALLELALPIPPEAVMHDWWLALAATAFGVIGHVAVPMVLYRQHGANDIGARPFNVRDIVGQLHCRPETRAIITRLQRQGAAFLERYRDRLTPAQREMLEVYARLDSFNGFLRRWYLLKYRFFYTGIIRNVGRLVIG